MIALKAIQNALRHLLTLPLNGFFYAIHPYYMGKLPKSFGTSKKILKKVLKYAKKCSIMIPTL